MDKVLLEKLRVVTQEEQEILDGKIEINESIYGCDDNLIFDAKTLLAQNKLITVRPHTRFVHFPKHSHNYVEVIYMCEGKTRHLINEEEVILKQGELLFLSQNATQEIYPAGKNDIAVNFIILPEFFDEALKMIGQEENPIRDFIIDCLKGNGKNNLGYLHFRVANILPVQNLLENMIWTIVNEQPNKRSIHQITMGLLFLQLLNYTETLEIGKNASDEDMLLTVLRYIEENYRDGELTQLADDMHYNLYWLSKMIKKKTGKTYTELVQKKRIQQAVFYLKNTNMSVAEIGNAVGYDNLSFFHKTFQKQTGMSPKKYRDFMGNAM